MKYVWGREQAGKCQAQLALLWRLLTSSGSMLADMAGAQAPNTDPILPQQQGPMNLAEGG